MHTLVEKISMLALSHVRTSEGLSWQLLSILCFLLVLLPAPALEGTTETVGRATSEEKAKVNQDMVFLVDTSLSMGNMFEDIRKAIMDYAKEAQPGDTIVLISFGPNVELRIRQKINSPQDIRAIEKELALLEPDQFYSYITAALDRGMEELRMLAAKSPEHLRTMVLLSDGKNNPPPTISDPTRFEDLLKRYPGLLQGPNSAFFYLSLGDNPDPEVIEWMQSAKGTSLDLSKETSSSMAEKRQLGFAQIFVEPVSIDLGTVYGPKATVPVSLAFFPARGNASGQGIQLRFKAAYQENPSWETLMEIKPSAVDCSKKPWSSTFSVEVDSLHEGIVVGTLELQPMPGNVLFIDPKEIPVTLTTRQPQMKVEMRERLRFGPIYPGNKYEDTKTISLISNVPAEPSDIRVTPSIGLPDGVSFKTAVVKQENQLQLLLTVESDGTFKSSKMAKIEGTLELTGATRTIQFSKDKIEVVVAIGPPPAQSRLLDSFVSKLNPTTILVLIALTAAATGCLAAWHFVRFRAASDLEGKLVLVSIRNKPFTKSRMISANLHTLGKSLKRDFITIGSAKEAGLTIPHESIAPYHCEISVRLEKGNKRIILEPLGENAVIVNLQKISEAVPLSDRDLIEVGAYTFRFENPHPYKQIVVKYLDGRILKGTPASWDIESDGFGLLPRDALPGSHEEIYIGFADLKAVYFVRDFDGQIGKKIVSPANQIRGVHMTITFHDNEKIEGYTTQTYSEDDPRFYFFPADQSGNTISMLVERRHLENIQLLGEGKLEKPSLSADATIVVDQSRKAG